MASHRQTTRKRPLDTLSARVRRAWVIDPRTVQWISYWDLVTTAALVFTALVTPVEVAFLEPTAVEARLSNALYLTNRAVDIVFITDMLLQFRVAIKLRDVKLGTYWVVNPATIARHYLLSKWFFLDFFSILTSLFDIVEFPGAKSLTALRSVRVLRLFKLIRLLRGSRIFKHWEMRMSINYAYLSLTQTIVMLVVGCHWFACIWGLQASFNPLGSWPGGTNYCVPYRADDDFAACPEGWRCNAAGGYSCVGAFKLYLYSLYFAIMTITSVGYGDILATPFNDVEQIICSLIMLLSGMIWGYLIGTFCNLASNLSPSVQLFRAELSRLNHFMSTEQLPDHTRFRLREFLHESEPFRSAEQRAALLARLSPAMQGEVSVLVNQRWVCEIWYLKRSAHPALLIELASQLKSTVFPPGELCPSGFLYIIQCGSTFYAGKALREGSVWGEDVLLNRPELQLEFPALTLAYVSVSYLNASTLTMALAKFPLIAKELHSVRMRWVARRAVVREAERMCHARGVPFRGRLRPIYAKELKSNHSVYTSVGPSQRTASFIERRAKYSKAAGGSSPSSKILSTPARSTPGGARGRKSGARTDHDVQHAASEYGLEMRRVQMEESSDSSSGGVHEVAGRLEGRMENMERRLNSQGEQLGAIVELLSRLVQNVPADGAVHDPKAGPEDSSLGFRFMRVMTPKGERDDLKA